MPRKVVCFLAHNGVFNKSLWQQWLTPDIGVIAYIRNPSDRWEETICGSRALCSTHTVWGDPSIVRVTAALLREALEKYPDALSFHIVSGYDVPICSTQEFLRQSDETVMDMGSQNTFTVQRGEVYLSHIDAMSMDIPRNHLHELATAVPGFTQACLKYHAQWMSLNRFHASVVASFDFNRLQPLHEYMTDPTRHQLLRERADEWARLGKINVMTAPDEYFIYCALVLSKATKGIKKAMLTMFLSRLHSDPSPIVFTDMDRTEGMFLVNVDGDYIEEFLTLDIALRASRQLRLDRYQPYLSFFRKVTLPTWDNYVPWRIADLTVIDPASRKRRRLA
jgi:hypothetical protein